MDGKITAGTAEEKGGVAEHMEGPLPRPPGALRIRLGGPAGAVEHGKAQPG